MRSCAKKRQKSQSLLELSWLVIRAKPLLAIKNGNPKYYALLSGQEMQILDNGIRLIGIDRLIKGDLKELE